MEIIGIYSTVPNLMSNAIKCLVDIHNFEQLTLMPSNLEEKDFLGLLMSDATLLSKETLYNDQSRRCLFVTDNEQAYWVRSYDGKVVFVLPIEEAKCCNTINKSTQINMREGDFLVPICSPDDSGELHDILASVLLEQRH